MAVAALLAVSFAGCSIDERDAVAPVAAGADVRGDTTPAAVVMAALVDASALARRITFSPCVQDPEHECGQRTGRSARAENSGVLETAVGADNVTRRGMLAMRPSEDARRGSWNGPTTRLWPDHLTGRPPYQLAT
jgi:hypothetical protein